MDIRVDVDNHQIVQEVAETQRLAFSLVETVRLFPCGLPSHKRDADFTADFINHIDDADAERGGVAERALLQDTEDIQTLADLLQRLSFLMDPKTIHQTVRILPIRELLLDESRVQITEDDTVKPRRHHRVSQIELRLVKRLERRLLREFLQSAFPFETHAFVPYRALPRFGQFQDFGQFPKGRTFGNRRRVKKFRKFFCRC